MRRTVPVKNLALWKAAAFAVMMGVNCISTAGVPPSEIEIRMISELEMVPIEIFGKTRRMAIRTYRPFISGPRPTLIFHPGSPARNAARIRRYHRYDGLIDYFVNRGWVVVVPSRLGRSGSEGRYADRDGKCDRVWEMVRNAYRTLEQVEALTNHIVRERYVDQQMIVVGGVSTGGYLSLLHAAKRPDLYRGVVNISGTWMGKGCGVSARRRGHREVITRSKPFPGETLWLYTRGDQVASFKQAQADAQIYESLGGRATLVSRGPDVIGHNLIFAPYYWRSQATAYLERLGLPHVPSTLSIPRLTIRDQPPLSGELLGTWNGRWSNTTRSQLFIEKITPEGGVHGSFQIGSSSKGWFYELLDSDGVLRISPFGNPLTYHFYVNWDGTLEGIYGTRSSFRRVIFAREREPGVAPARNRRAGSATASPAAQTQTMQKSSPYRRVDARGP